ncbi:MAG TPA: Fe-S cluster assembly ATPase SufC [Candidatus Glassbacteria bacterium]|nr:Fe-S cluster assembly ATPase SufC [Candidatus Glassbacteria bacterium]
MSKPILVLENLTTSVEGKEILKGVSLEVPYGEVHALMGPNGSGKSTLANVLMGHPAYKLTGGRIFFKGQDVTEVEPDERGRLGMFLAFQYPVEIPGVSMMNFLRQALNSRREQEVKPRDFLKMVQEKLEMLGMDPSFTKRNLNEGFSGGEKKRNEVLQLAILQPELAILDETDSGLDIDAVRIVSQAVNTMRGPEISFLVITHYMRILNYLDPDVVHIMFDGRIVQSGGPELAHQLEEKGYDSIRAQFGAELEETTEEAAAR